jgi:hypothetical protein
MKDAILSLANPVVDACPARVREECDLDATSLRQWLPAQMNNLCNIPLLAQKGEH